MAVEDTRRRTRARWTALGALGLLSVIAGALVLMVGIVAFGLDAEGEEFFLLTVSGIALVGASLAWFFGWWGKVLGIVAALMCAMALFWTAFGFEGFPSFFDFMPAVLVIPGAILAVAALISSIVAGRRGNRTAKPTGNERAAIRVTLGIVGVVAVVTGALTLFGRTSIAPESADARIVMSDFEFPGEEITFEAGWRVIVRNDDPFVHTFTIDELGIDETVMPGDEVLVDIPNRRGEFVLYCRPHTETPDDPDYDSDMAARLTVG